MKITKVQVDDEVVIDLPHGAILTLEMEEAKDLLGSLKEFFLQDKEEVKECERQYVGGKDCNCVLCKNAEELRSTPPIPEKLEGIYVDCPKAINGLIDCVIDLYKITKKR